MKPRELAAHIGLMSQNMQIPFDYTVEDVVRMGRYRMRRRGLFEAENREDGRRCAMRWKPSGFGNCETERRIRFPEDSSSASFWRVSLRSSRKSSCWMSRPITST